MTIFAITFALIAGLTGYLYFKERRERRIVRHLAIHYLDWCARKIEEVAGMATAQINALAMELAKARGQNLTLKQAMDEVSFSTLDAVRERRSEKEKFQSRLERNGIEPLGVADLGDLIWNPGSTSLKP
ncbi:hypothetical protein GRI58_05460 [Porphyrobacter algicida]|uniref:Uncharacterized protein n=1 Tax=Qipengyuania algicida TaxID=1836209 RepID=A0A845AFM1_9SPHN|nr:hypothetical protein [Qipengyuania algicida]MXP28267.1 hypothetical protein [Qipengyuania algicida]